MLLTEEMVCRTSGDGGVGSVVLGRALSEAALLLVVGTLSAGAAGITLLVESLLWNGAHHSGALGAAQLLWNGGFVKGWLLNGGGYLGDLGLHSLFGICPYEHRVDMGEGQRHGLQRHGGARCKC